MRNVRLKALIWGVMAMVVLLSAGCSTTAYNTYLNARDEYDRCVQRAGGTSAQCDAERDKLNSALGAYEREADRNYWWRNAIEDAREKEPLSPFDRKRP